MIAQARCPARRLPGEVAMAVVEKRSFCRICNAACGMVLDIDGGRIVAVRPDKRHRLSRGYACFKGLQAAQMHHGPQRLLHALRRRTDGGFERVGLEQALDEIAARLGALIDADGPDAVGMYGGTAVVGNQAAYAMWAAFMAAIGSRQRYSTLTIDQSAKLVSFERLGGWAGGQRQVDEVDLVLLVGVNPVISHGAYQCIGVDPTRTMKAARARGTRFVVIDPRRTQTAHLADLHLQPLPGFDAAIAAALLRTVLDEGWQDRDFCARYVGAEALGMLHAALTPFDAAAVERAAGLPTGQIAQAARMFAYESRNGYVNTGTGPNMGPHSNLAVHLFDCLNVVCGRFPRAGDRVRSVDPTAPAWPPRAEVIAPARSWSNHPPSRIRGMGWIGGERPASTLADEILTPGAGRLRALIVSGGNPATAVPDQRRIVKALRALDLLVVIEPVMSATARLAHYILPPRLMYERDELAFGGLGWVFFPKPWAQYARAVIEPPPDSELVEEWYPFWAIARRLGRAINYCGVDLDMQRPPTTSSLLSIKLRGARISLEELEANPDGVEPDLGDCRVQSGTSAARFEPMADDIAAELRAAAADLAAALAGADAAAGFTHRLAVHRLSQVMNSSGMALDAVRRRLPGNPAFVHPDDLAALGCADGERITIESAHGRIEALARADANVRSGTVAISHGWGGLPDEDAPGDEACTNLLVSCEQDVEPVNAMPRMTGIPVRLSRT
ncbi:MAG: molybdopterin-dependent oxidoreductase [Gammaproteobacteria bacterium]